MEFESTTMAQYALPGGHCGYRHFPGGRQPSHECYYLPPPPPTPPLPPPPPPPTNYFPPHNHRYPLPYNPAGSQNYFNNAFPGYSVNAGGNWYAGNGIQSNGDVKLGYGSRANLNNGEMKRKKRKSTVIGGCHNNQGGHQVSGDVILGDVH